MADLAIEEVHGANAEELIRSKEERLSNFYKERECCDLKPCHR